MNYGSKVKILLILFFTLTALSNATAGEIGINIFGLSYHPDRKDSSGRHFDEINPGAGVNYIFHETPRNIFQFDGGVFRNSGGDVAEYVGGGYRLKFFRNFSAGGEVVYFHSATYNNGDPAFGLIPMASYRWNPVTFTLMYLPKYKQINRNAAFALYGTVHFGSL